MEHNLFKPKNIEEAMHTVVGDCNGIPSKDRWEIETPAFAKAILREAGEIKPGFTILDYGCGCGRIAKEILKQNDKVTVIGLDPSEHELIMARNYISDSRFIGISPEKLNQKVDLVYSVYCLQHVPAIELRECLQRIHHFLKDDGKFIYCSSDYRMAIRFDDQGFFDDRFLGVNIRENIKRLFKDERHLFSFDEISNNRVVDALVNNSLNISGGITHPANIYTKRLIDGPIFNATAKNIKAVDKTLEGEDLVEETTPKKILLRNRQSPGDILVMSCAIRSLHRAYPGKYLTAVQSPCNDIFQNNPYVTKCEDKNDFQVIDMHYPLISDHRARGFTHPGAGVSGRHFTDGHRKYLEDILEIEIPRTGLAPDIFLSKEEIEWPSPVFKEHGYDGKYWVLNAGAKNDFPLKHYHNWQKVVDLFKELNPEIQVVQVGQIAKGHLHPPLVGVIDMLGKTNVREFIRLIHHADGVFTCVSFAMHLAAALETPCVVVAGGRESPRWELYPNQRFLHTGGALDCCRYDGCWKSKIKECEHKTEANKALCLEMIKPAHVVEAAQMYYEGGMIKKEEVLHAS